MTIEELYSIIDDAKNMGYTVNDYITHDGERKFTVSFPNVPETNTIIDYTLSNKKLISIAGYSPYLHDYYSSNFCAPLNWMSVEHLKKESVIAMLKKYLELEKQYNINKKLEKIEQDF